MRGEKRVIVRHHFDLFGASQVAPARLTRHLPLRFVLLVTSLHAEQAFIERDNF